jgi:hypothetical protein
MENNVETKFSYVQIRRQVAAELEQKRRRVFTLAACDLTDENNTKQCHCKAEYITKEMPEVSNGTWLGRCLETLLIRRCSAAK